MNGDQKNVEILRRIVNALEEMNNRIGDLEEKTGGYFSKTFQRELYQIGRLINDVDPNLKF